MPINIQETDRPYQTCPFYNDQSASCCGREHDQARQDQSQRLLQQTVPITDSQGTSTSIRKYELTSPRLLTDSWVSKFERSVPLEQLLQDSPQIGSRLRQQTGVQFVTTPIRGDCPIAQNYYLGSDSSPAPVTELVEPSAPDC